jgi:hypothetical protein
MIVPVELSRIAISENSHAHVIWLKEKDGQRAFPILIGVFATNGVRPALLQSSNLRGGFCRRNG